MYMEEKKVVSKDGQKEMVANHEGKVRFPCWFLNVASVKKPFLISKTS